MTPTDNLEAGAGDLVATLLRWAEVLEIPSGDFVNEDLRRAAAQLAAVTAENARLREALDRQCDNMAFVLNRVNLHAWHDKFSRELEEDRAALSQEAPK